MRSRSRLGLFVAINAVLTLASKTGGDPVSGRRGGIPGGVVMRALPMWMIACWLVVTWVGAARAQAFMGAPVVMLGVGALTPAGEMSNAYGVGIAGRLGLRLPISQGTSFGVEAGIVAPNEKAGSRTLYQFPVRALLYFPLASEASSTPYVAVGPGVTFNSVSGDGAPGDPDQRDPYFTYALKLGWAFRPEHMTSTLFEIGARYEQQFIGHSNDFYTFDVEACVGRTF